MNINETNNEIAWRLLREARLAKPGREFDTYYVAASWLDEGPLEDVEQLDEMHAELAEIEAKIPEWQRR